MTKERDQVVKISDATVKRLSRYYRSLATTIQNDVQTISSEEIAKMNGLTAAQVRKDLSFFGAFGRRGLGYNVIDLHRNISRILGLHRTWNVCLVGVGNIGRALVHFRQFQQQGFYIKLVMDNDPEKWGLKLNGLEVKNFEHAKDLIKDEKIKIGIVAVPAHAAQRVVDVLVDAGIKAILNFAPVSIFVPRGVAVRNENMAIEMEALSYALTNKRR
jgi:redox-sensing transcriptional repressor